MRDAAHQSGYTLIELLLYIVIAGSLLTSITYFFGTVVDARVKNQTINEVNDQGAMVMDMLGQTIRNATSVTTPATGAVDKSLTLVVPTGSLSPTVFDTTGGAVLGYNTDGTSTDTSDSNSIQATKFSAPANGTVTTLYASVGSVAASPNNKAQMAIYSGASSPSTLLASSAEATLTPNNWNAFDIPTVSIVSGQTYWIAYSTNGLAAADNNLRYHAGTANQSIFIGQAYGTWPASWTGTADNNEYSIYAPINVTSSPAQMRIKEGTSAAVPLTSQDVQITGLNFKNLTRSGTAGVVQYTFTISRLNPNNRNEYDYQKTFTGTAELGW